MSDQGGADNEKRAKPQSGFEANLRGKLSKGFGFVSREIIPKPAPSSAPAVVNTTQDEDVAMGEADEISQIQPEEPEFTDVMDINDMPDQEYSARRSRDDLIFKIMDAEEEMGIDPTEDPDDYEGDSADRDRYHRWTTIPVKQTTIAVNLHGNDSQWLKNHPVIPDGIRSPEGYLWGRKQSDMLWFEIQPNSKRRGTISQQYALDNRVVHVYKVDENGKAEPEPSLVGTCDDPYFLRLCCGEPTPFNDLLYNTHPLMPELRGPEILDAYIPPSELPVWLYVYDENDLTVLDTPTPDYTDADWLASNQPLLSIPSDVKPLKYRLVDPSGRNVIDDDPPVDPEEHHATLILSQTRVIGSGSKSRVYEGQISLQDPKFPSRLRVVAKLNRDGKEKYLENEAMMYNLFPDSFSREYSGLQIVEPSHFARPLTRVVPAFYGYYKHVPDHEEPQDSQNPGESTDAENSGDDTVINRNLGAARSSILLMEYCGKPINPYQLTQYQKLDIMSLIDRFHKAGFIYGDNQYFTILRQPGPHARTEPLSRTPRWARTAERPSWRLATFGETEWFGMRSERDRLEKIFKRQSSSLNHYLSSERRELGNYVRLRLH